MTLQRILVSLALGLAGTTLVAAQTSVPIIALDSTEFDLSERSAAKQTVDYFIPAKFNVDGVHVRRWSISQGGKIIDPAGSTIEFRDVVGQRATLFVAFSLANLKTAGAYVATVEFAAPEPPKPPNAPGAEPATGEHKPPALPAGGEVKSDTPAAVAPPAAAAAAPSTQPKPKIKELEQTVQLKLTKPAAELRVSTPLQLSNTVYFFWKSSLEPSKITFNEASGKSFVSIDRTTWNVELRRGSDPTEENRLTVQLPSAIDGFGQATASANLEGPISIGTTSGTLTVRTAQLAAQSVDFPLTIVTRIAAAWLFPVIVVGILLGWLFRNRLEARRTRLEAVIPAEQEIATLDDLIAKTVDTKFKADFETARAALAGAIEAKRGTADTIKAATTAAATRREAISKEIGDLTNRLHTDLDSWHWLTAVGGPLPDCVAPALAPLRTTVQDLINRLGDNLISAVDTDAKRTLPDLKGALIRALEESLDHIDEFKAVPPKPWPDTRLAAVLQTVAAEADRLRQALSAADTPDKLGQIMINTVHLLRTMQEQLFGRVLGDARTTAEAVGKALVARDPTLKPDADAITAAAAALPDGSAAGTPNAADTFVKQLDALRAVIVSGLQSAWDDTSTVMPGSAEGRFVDALAALAKKPKPGSGDQALSYSLARDRSIELLRADLQRTIEVQADQNPPQWTVQLDAPEATVSEAVVVHARLIALDGRDPPRVTLYWYQDGNSVGVTEPGVLERTFKFSQPGSVVVQVTAAGGGEPVAARIAIQVRAPHGASVIAASEESYARAECLQNLMSAAIILWAGWLIFSPTFVGTIAEFFAAFLWGFSVDIGAAKVRELTETVKTLKPSIPIPR